MPIAPTNHWDNQKGLLQFSKTTPMKGKEPQKQIIHQSISPPQPDYKGEIADPDPP